MQDIARSSITIVCPAYNEGEMIVRFYDAVSAILEPLSIDWNIIFIDDGSTDDTFAHIERLHAADPRVNGLALARNFGKEAAMSAGLEHSDADAVVVLDCDLQHPVSLIPEMVRLWREENYEVVDAVKERRGDEPPLRRWGARFFTFLLCKLSGFDFAGASDFKLLDRKVIDCLVRLEERQTFYRGLTEWLGFRHARLPFQVERRELSGSKWSVIHLGKLALTALTAFSALPLHLVTIMGMAFIVAGMLMALRALYLWVEGTAVEGITTVVILQLLIGGMLATSLGIIGEYVSRIYYEVKRRPKYILKAHTLSGNSLNG